MVWEFHWGASVVKKMYGDVTGGKLPERLQERETSRGRLEDYCQAADNRCQLPSRQQQAANSMASAGAAHALAATEVGRGRGATGSSSSKD